MSRRSKKKQCWFVVELWSHLASFFRVERTRQAIPASRLHAENRGRARRGLSWYVAGSDFGRESDGRRRRRSAFAPFLFLSLSLSFFFLFSQCSFEKRRGAASTARELERGGKRLCELLFAPLCRRGSRAKEEEYFFSFFFPFFPRWLHSASFLLLPSPLLLLYLYLFFFQSKQPWLSLSAPPAPCSPRPPPPPGPRRPSPRPPRCGELGRCARR